jgi:TRAP-type C4-dicarboxylate transport system permease small subunit
MSLLLSTHDRVSRAAFVVSCVALLVLLGAYLVEVIARYGFGAPTRWSSDVVQYALCVSMALALPIVTRDGGHVAITSFLEKASVNNQAIAARWIAVLGALTLTYAAYLCASTALTQMRDGIETVAAFAIPKAWLTWLVTYGFADSALHLLRQCIGLDTARAGHEMDV